MNEISNTRRNIGYVVLALLLIGMAVIFVPKIIDLVDIKQSGFADDLLTDEQEQKLRQDLIKEGVTLKTLQETIEPIIGADELLKKCNSLVGQDSETYNEKDAHYCLGFFQGFLAGKFVQDRIEFEGICMPITIWENGLAKLYVEYTSAHLKDLYNEHGVETGYTVFIIRMLKQEFPCSVD